MNEKINEIKEFCDYVIELESKNKELENTCRDWFETYHKLRIKNEYKIKKLEDKINKINNILNKPMFEYDNILCNIENEIQEIKDILKEN